MPFLNSVEGSFAFGKPGPVSTFQIATSSLQIWVDAGNNASYPGSGSTWSNLVSANAGTYWYNLSNSPSVSNVVYNNTSNNALSFNGTTQFAVNNASLATLALNNNWNETREYWVFWRGTPGCLITENGVAAPDTNWYDAQTSFSNTNVYATVWQNGLTPYTTATGFTSNAWNHIVWQWNNAATTMIMYVNGVQTFSSNIGARVVPTSFSYGYFMTLFRASLTNYARGSESNLDGCLAIFRWYNNVLTSNQVWANFNAERSRFGR